MIPKASPLCSLFSNGRAGNAAANAASATVRPLFLTAQTRGMSPTYAETASGLVAERPLQPRSQGGIKPSRMTPGTNPAGRTMLGVRTGGAARGTNEPPPSRFTGIAHFWAVTSTSLCCPAWAGGTQPAAFSITTLEHPLPAEKMSFSAGRSGCLVVQFCQAPLHLNKNTCMPAWLEHTLCVLLGRDCTRWARLLRHRGKHFPSLSPNPHCQDSEQHAPASAAILLPLDCQCPLAASCQCPAG